MSRVTETREILRKVSNIKNDDVNKMSYINTFLKYKKASDHQDMIGDPQKVVKLKIRNMSTLNILHAVHNSFINVDKVFISKIEGIRKELLTRTDLFISIVEIMENNDVMYDDLYYWYPGIKNSDVFSFFLSMLPNLIDLYKEYYIKACIVGQVPMTKILDVFKHRMNKNLVSFDIIKMDLELFNDKYVSVEHESMLHTEYDELVSNANSKTIKRKEKVIKNGIRKRSLKIKNDTISLDDKDKENKIKFIDAQDVRSFKIVTGYFWKDNEEEEEDCTEALNAIGDIEVNKRFNEDIKLELCPSLSYVDITIGNKDYRVTILQFNDLLTKNNRSKNFWMNCNLIDQYWNFIE